MLHSLTRWKRLLSYIDEHLHEPMSTRQLSQVVHLSAYHFHRQFFAHFGINLGDYINRVRLRQAAFLLAYRPHMSITQISFSVGFNNCEVFSRAFKRFTGCSPSEFRRCPPWAFLFQLNHLLNKIKGHPMLPHTPDYPVELVELDSIAVALFRHQGAPENLAFSLQQFIQWRKNQGLPPSAARTFNIVHTPYDIEPAENFCFDFAVELKAPRPLDDGPMRAGQTPAGLHARVCYTGDDAGVEQAINYLYATWLKQAPYRLREAPLLIERVTFYPEVELNQRTCHIYLPVAAV